MSHVLTVTITDLTNSLRQIVDQAATASGIKPAAKPTKPRKEKAK